MIEIADIRPWPLPATSDAEIVVLADLESSFIGGFASAEETDTLLMTDVGVIWRRESVEIPEL